MAKISPKNSKLGNIPNISLTPCATCRPDAPCKKTCYAMKAYRMYPSVRNAWDTNTAEYAENPTFFEADTLRQVPLMGVFRWQVSGDIIDDNYLAMMVRIAEQRPDVKFLAFTKQYEIVNRYEGEFPKNLKVVLSGWKGLEFDNPKNLPVAWYLDPKDPDNRIPVDALPCSGHCASCMVCWKLDNGDSVVFEKH